MNNVQYAKADAAKPGFLRLSSPDYRHRRMAGLTIIQLMVTLLIAGIAGALVVEFIIDKRCEDDPPVKLCMDRKAGGK